VPKLTFFKNPKGIVILKSIWNQIPEYQGLKWSFPFPLNIYLNLNQKEGIKNSPNLNSKNRR
jgi:hypothetical protein